MTKYKLTFSSGVNYTVIGDVIYHANDGIFEFNFKLVPELKKEFDQHTEDFFKIGLGLVNFRVKESYYDILGLEYKAFGYYLI